MKIVNREQFMQLPAGTLYSLYTPFVMNGLYLRGETFAACDFLQMNLIGQLSDVGGDFETACDRMEAGESVPVEFRDYERDGMFDNLQQFAVYENKDIRAMIGVLMQAVEATEPHDLR